MASHTKFSRTWRDTYPVRWVAKDKRKMKNACSRFARRFVKAIIRITEDFDEFIHTTTPYYTEYDI
jgi:hypothetical protein